MTTAKGMLTAKILALGAVGSLVGYTVTTITLNALALWLVVPKKKEEK